jgi:hypothetical protein
MKIGIAWPNTNLYYPKYFTESAFRIYRPPEHEYAHLIPYSDGPVDAVRNELCQQAILNDCTHIFWMDTDQQYPQDTLIRLIEHNLPVVCAKVHRRKAPYDPLLKRVNPDKEDKNNPYVDVDVNEWAFSQNQLIEVDSTGFGCNLMSMEIIDKMDKPWFMFDLYVTPVVGEDVFFWRKVKKLGYKIFVDCSIDIGHIAPAIVKSNSYFEYRRQMEKQALG